MVKKVYRGTSSKLLHLFAIKTVANLTWKKKRERRKLDILKKSGIYSKRWQFILVRDKCSRTFFEQLISMKPEM